MDPLMMASMLGGGGGGGGGPLGGGATSSAESGPITTNQSFNLGGFAIPAVPALPGTMAASGAAVGLNTPVGSFGVSNKAVLYGGLALLAVLMLKRKGKL